MVNLLFVSDDLVRLSWKRGAEVDVRILLYTIEVIGAYITAGARIHLYRYLDMLRKNAKYCDTDSVIYIQQRNVPALIETGAKLGDMTSELRPSEFIFQFVSGGS